MGAFGVTVVIVLALTLFAFQTKFDFTGFGPYMIIFLIILIGMGIATIFVRNKILMICYSALGVLIFSVYLVIDTQMMMGKSHKFSISPEDYIFAVVTLYIDIIMIFLYLLQIFGASR